MTAIVFIVLRKAPVTYLSFPPIMLIRTGLIWDWLIFGLFFHQHSQGAVLVTKLLLLHGNLVDLYSRMLKLQSLLGEIWAEEPRDI